jgi:hypothetical protein
MLQRLNWPSVTESINMYVIVLFKNAIDISFFGLISIEIDKKCACQMTFSYDISLIA